jgi:hypothetical protein
MNLLQHVNGTTLNFKVITLNINLRKITTLIQGKKYKFALLQINRFENGYVSIYFRLFFKYSITITGIKLKEGKGWFFGNKENNN